MPDWRKIARTIAEQAGIDPDLFERQIQAESNFDPNARSPAGAIGLAQIVPKYHPNVDPSDPVASLRYAARWMAQLIVKYNGDIRKALANYNGGVAAVQAQEAGHPFTETVAYENAILPPGEQGGRVEPTQQGATDTRSAAGSLLYDLQQAKGEPVSVIKRPSTEKIKAKDAFGEVTEINNPEPTWRFTYKDGTYLDVQAKTEGEPQIIGGTAMASAAKAENKPKITPAANLEPIKDPNTGRVVKLRDPSTGQVIDLPDQPAGGGQRFVTVGGRPYTVEPATDANGDPTGGVRLVPVPGVPEAKAKAETPERVTIGTRIYERGENGWQLALEAGREPPTALQEAQTAETQARTQQIQQGLLPKQLAIIQNHQQTIAKVQQMMASGQIDQATANGYIAASKAVAEAGLRGTTPFDEAKLAEDTRQANQTAGFNAIHNRLATGANLAQTMMSGAANLSQGAIFAPGQTSLHLDPLAVARSYLTGLYGGKTQETDINMLAQALAHGASRGMAGGMTPPPMMSGPQGAIGPIINGVGVPAGVYAAPPTSAGNPGPYPPSPLGSAPPPPYADVLTAASAGADLSQRPWTELRR